MSSIVTSVFRATIGLLVNKGRDKAAEKLKDGNVTDQKLRGLIVREIEDVKKKLDGLSRKDLLASISFFKEEIEFLYKVFDGVRSRSEYGAVTTQAACAEAYSLAQGMRNLQLTDLDESAMRALSSAKKRFEDSRREARRAFNNVALETSDRILAMQYRIMATILETVDNPADAVAPCRVCIEELNSLPAVQKSFDVHIKKGLVAAAKALVGKEERSKIISNVCHVNYVIFDVTQIVGQYAPIWIWPSVDIGEDKVDPLRDGRITKDLRQQGMEHCCVEPCSFGQEGEKEHKLKDAMDIATNSNEQFIIGDYEDSNVKVFDSNGAFIKLLSLPNDDADREVAVLDVATDMNDNIYVLTRLKTPCAWTCERPDWKSKDPSDLHQSYRRIPVDWIYERSVYKFINNTFDVQQKFPLGGAGVSIRLTVTDSGKALVLRYNVVVDVYETNGQFVLSFGEGKLKNACDITAANDGRVMLVEYDDFCVHVFSENGDHLNKFKLQGRSYFSLRIAFHRASEHVVVAGQEEGKDLLHLETYTKDGEFVRNTQIQHEAIGALGGVTVTSGGRIAVRSL